MADDKQVAVATVTMTPDDVENEAKKFAMRAGGLMLLAMSEKGLTEKELSETLGVNPRQLRTTIMGEGWRAYLPIAALSLALGVKLELRLTPTER